MALHEAASSEDVTVLLISPSQRQSGELLTRVRRLLNHVTDRVPAVANESALQLRFENGSRVLSLPSTESTVRGFAADVIVLDEAARVEEDLIEAVRPMLAATGGRMIALSTPWGRRGWFHSSWVGEGAWHRTMVRADQCTRIRASFLAEERATLPDLVYRAEYECEFGDVAGSAFRAEDIDAAVTEEVSPRWPDG